MVVVSETRDSFAARTFAGLAEYYRLLADTEHRSSFVEQDGIVAAIVPATPDDAMFNSVVYPAQLDVGALDEFGSLYQSHQINAWGIWVYEEDKALQASLRASGFSPIASWLGMGRSLTDDVATVLPKGMEVGRVEVDEFSCSNDDAHLSDDYRRAFASPPRREGVVLWGLRNRGRLVSALLEVGTADDCSIHSVSTIRCEWGKGNAAALMQGVLAAARRAGRDTSTLQSAPLAESLYRRLGYTPNRAWRVWATNSTVAGSSAAGQ